MRIVLLGTVDDKPEAELKSIELVPSSVTWEDVTQLVQAIALRGFWFEKRIDSIAVYSKKPAELSQIVKDLPRFQKVPSSKNWRSVVWQRAGRNYWPTDRRSQGFDSLIDKTDQAIDFIRGIIEANNGNPVTTKYLNPLLCQALGIPLDRTGGYSFMARAWIIWRKRELVEVRKGPAGTNTTLISIPK